MSERFDTIDGYRYCFTELGDSVEILGCDDTEHGLVTPEPSGNLTIPQTLGGKPVLRIGDYAFAGFRELVSVQIPEGVEVVSLCAFKGCEKLTQISYPSTMREIWPLAFSGCDLRNVVLPEGLVRLEHRVFEKNVNLETVELPSTLKTVPDSGFSNLPNLKKVKLADGTEKIGAFAFSNNPLLEDVILSDGLVKISNYAFEQCHSIREITIPASVKNVGVKAFSGCGNLRKVVFAGKCKIDPTAFEGCSEELEIVKPSKTARGKKAKGNKSVLSDEYLVHVAAHEVSVRYVKVGPKTADVSARECVEDGDYAEVWGFELDGGQVRVCRADGFEVVPPTGLLASGCKLIIADGSAYKVGDGRWLDVKGVVRGSPGRYAIVEDWESGGILTLNIKKEAPFEFDIAKLSFVVSGGNFLIGVQYDGRSVDIGDSWACENECDAPEPSESYDYFVKIKL